MFAIELRQELIETSQPADEWADAGCRDETILDHCRRDAPHARGCWLLDLILSKDR